MISLARLYTLIRVKFLNLLGIQIQVGKKTIISRKADLLGRRIVIGDNCYVGSYTLLDASSGDIEIGDKTTIGRQCIVHGGVTIAYRCRIASHVCIIPSDHNFKDKNIYIKDQGAILREIDIGSDVWIAAHCSILSGSG